MTAKLAPHAQRVVVSPGISCSWSQPSWLANITEPHRLRNDVSHDLRRFDRVRVGRVAHGRIVAVRADGPGSATLMRLMAVESGQSGLRAANPGRPGIAVTRANATMMRAVVVSAGRAVRGATPRHYRCGGRKRPKSPCAACRPVGGIR